MKVPLSWLREYVEVPVEVERLAEALTLVGLAVEGIDKTGGDAVLDVDVTTNRVDCMNVYGVARELSVIYGRPLKPHGWQPWTNQELLRIMLRHVDANAPRP